MGRSLHPVCSLRVEDVEAGMVIRYGTAGRWEIVLEVDDGPQGVMVKLMHASGPARGELWDETHFGLVEGWARLDQNRHALFQRYGRVVAKDRRDARRAIEAVLGNEETIKLMGRV